MCPHVSTVGASRKFHANLPIMWYTWLSSDPEVTKQRCQIQCSARVSAFSGRTVLANEDLATVQRLELTIDVTLPMQLFIHVSGRVQGVGFREFVRRSAEKFGVYGYAKNLASGDVEVVAEGHKLALDEFLVLLEKGPPAGRVDRVQIDKRECGGEYTGFDIRF